MTESPRQISAGRVGRPHGLDGSFHLERASEPLAPGDAVEIAGRASRVERVAGTEQRPILRVTGVAGRDAAETVRGEPVLIEQTAADLAPGEYFSEDLVGCTVAGVGVVRAVVGGPSCDVLEVGEEAILVPLVRHAVRRIDTAARVIEVDLAFLGLA